MGKLEHTWNHSVYVRWVGQIHNGQTQSSLWSYPTAAVSDGTARVQNIDDVLLVAVDVSLVVACVRVHGNVGSEGGG